MQDSINEIKLSGIILKKEKSKNDKLLTMVVLGVPSAYARYYGIKSKDEYYCYSFFIYTHALKRFPELRKGNAVEIEGKIMINNDYEGSGPSELFIDIKNVKKGVDI